MKTKNLFITMAAVALLGFPASCEKDAEEVKTFDVAIHLEYPAEYGLEPAAGVPVTLRNTITGDVNEAATNASGVAAFTVIAGVYEASASEVRTDDLYKYIINGTNSHIAVTDKWANGTSVALPLTVTPTLLPGVTPQTYSLAVQLEYTGSFEPQAGVTVSLKSTTTGAASDTTTDASGAATFTVVPGIYTVSVEEVRTDAYFKYVFSKEQGNIAVTTRDTVITLSLTATALPLDAPTDYSPYHKLIIKELYTGGCQKDDGSGAFRMDSYVIIYNNSSQPAAIDNLAFGTLFPHNAHATAYFWVNSAWTYASENWLPSASAWQITNRDTLAPGEQRVVVVYQAIDHTPTYSNSVNLANADYYVAYDLASGYTNSNYYKSPSELIPTAQYLKAYRFPGVTANAWGISVNSPGFFIFTPRDNIALNEFANASENHTLHGTNATQVTLKVPKTWVIDGIEVWQDDAVDRSKIRFTPDVNIGYIAYTNNYGNTLYRNVDKERTKAILGNAGRLVYEYSLGYENSTDPSGIDAEASIRNGAHIIYKETNNTTQDFHQRSRASLRN
jgi:hypothetical protein